MELALPPRTVVALHQATWQALPPAVVARQVVCLGFSPTWVRPFDRALPGAGALDHRSAAERWLLSEPRPPTEWWCARRSVQRWPPYGRAVCLLCDWGKRTIMTSVHTPRQPWACRLSASTPRGRQG